MAVPFILILKLFGLRLLPRNPECSCYHCVGQRWAHRGFQDPTSEAALVAAAAQVGLVVKYAVRSPAGLTPVARPNFL